jgi:hypothetical protein
MVDAKMRRLAYDHLRKNHRGDIHNSRLMYPLPPERIREIQQLAILDHLTESASGTLSYQ